MTENEHTESLVLWSRLQRDDDTSAFDTLFYRYSDVLYNYGMYLVDQPEEVQDAIQEVFVTIWRQRKRLKIERSFKQYLLIMYRRQLFKNKDKFRVMPINEDNENFEAISNPEHILIQNELAQYSKEKIQEAFKKLSIREKEVVLLRYFEGEKSEQVAKIMDIDINSVYKLLSKSVAKLKKSIIHF